MTGLVEASKNVEHAVKERGKGSYRRRRREKESDPRGPSVSESGRKRGVEDPMVLDPDLALKKSRKKRGYSSMSKDLKAGLSEQLRRTQ